MEESGGPGRRFPERVGGFLLKVYFLVFLVATPYFNWTYAREHGLVSWFFLGEIVATGKAIAWPYFAAKSAALGGQARAPASSTPHYEAHCKEPLPVFTLGEHSSPTREQEAALCACIWQTLGAWERRVSEKIAQGRESEVSWLDMHAFPSRFGSAIEQCGGAKL